MMTSPNGICLCGKLLIKQSDVVKCNTEHLDLTEEQTYDHDEWRLCTVPRVWTAALTLKEICIYIYIYKLGLVTIKKFLIVNFLKIND